MVTLVVKYGGNALAAGAQADDPVIDDPVISDCAARVRAGDRVVLVHGGGPQIDAALAARGVATKRVEGLRVTDGPTLEITEAVLCGTVNKALVRALISAGVPAIGISGEDGGLLRASRREELGFVGGIPSVDPAPLEALLAAGYTPVVAPLALDLASGSALNVNADESAGAIAGALHADAYIVVTNVARVRARPDDPATALAHLSREEARSYLSSGAFDGGMRPKIEGALEALERGVRRALVCGAGAGAITRALGGDATTIE